MAKKVTTTTPSQAEGTPAGEPKFRLESLASVETPLWLAGQRSDAGTREGGADQKPEQDTPKHPEVPSQADVDPGMIRVYLRGGDGAVKVIQRGDFQPRFHAQSRTEADRPWSA